MNLPIDVRKAPFKDKYLEETHVLATWFMFGRDPRDGTYQLSTADGDVFVGLSGEQAEALVTVRDEFLKEVRGILNHHRGNRCE